MIAGRTRTSNCLFHRIEVRDGPEGRPEVRRSRESPYGVGRADEDERGAAARGATEAEMEACATIIRETGRSPKESGSGTIAAPSTERQE